MGVEGWESDQVALMRIPEGWLVFIPLFCETCVTEWEEGLFWML